MQNQDLSSASADDQPSFGDIKVNLSVVASIVRLAALEIEGVASVGGGFVDGIADLFSKKESDRGVRVNEDENGDYLIEIRLVMDFGTELAKTAYDVQMAVRDQVINMTGKNVKKVDVVIEGVKMIGVQKEPKHREEEWSETGSDE